MVLVAMEAGAQGLKFGKYHADRSRRITAAKQTRPVSHATAATTGPRKSGALLDEASEVRGNYRFRFVYGYNLNRERSSEIIYMREKVDGTWGAESLYDVGTYTYEYDSQSRVKSKTVVYGKSNDGGLFTSYKVLVDYGPDVVSYTKYEYSGTDYQITEGWSYHDNGQLASRTFYDYDGKASSVTTFDTNGGYASIQHDGFKCTYSGELNDSTFTYYSPRWNPDDGYYFVDKRYSEHYRYDQSTGRIAEYSTYSHASDCSVENLKYVYSYDNLGRISSIKKYYTGDDEDVYPVNPVANQAKAASDEPDWVLEYNETYTYFNNEVYGMGNSWHDVFDMEGPVSLMRIEDEGYVTEMRFARGADGKITAITYNEENIPDVNRSYDFTVDAEGHITGYVIQENESDYYQSKSVYSYVWEGDRIVKSSLSEEYKDTSDSRTSTSTTDYKYGDNCLTVTEDDGYSIDVTYYEQKNGRYIVKSGNSEYDYDNCMTIVETQKEDVSFVRPNVMKDLDGFAVDSTIVVSVAGRVVCVNDKSYGRHGWSYGADDKDYFFNVLPSSYYSVSHVDGNTVCSDIKDRPVFVLRDGRLMREYVYHDDVYYPNVEPSQVKAAASIALPEDQSYDIITWTYSPQGLPVGRSFVSVDEDGTRSEEIVVEYVYDPATGIASAIVGGAKGITLDGRTLGMASGSAFSVYDMSGRVLASDVSTYTFASSGTYIVATPSGSVKVAVR